MPKLKRSIYRHDSLSNLALVEPESTVDVSELKSRNPAPGGASELTIDAPLSSSRGHADRFVRISSDWPSSIFTISVHISISPRHRFAAVGTVRFLRPERYFGDGTEYGFILFGHNCEPFQVGMTDGTDHALRALASKLGFPFSPKTGANYN
jgi:hypothetical protein